MPLPRSVVRHLAFPLHERLRGRRTVPMLRWMRGNDRRSRDELEARHEELLVALLRRAAAQVPYYRERVSASDVRDASDLKRFPLLDKPAVRANLESLRAEGFRGPLVALETGGSSGEPLRFYSDPVREASQLACKWRARAWWGVDPGHRESDLWGSPIEAAKGGRARRVAAWALGFRLLSAFELNDATMGAFRARLQEAGTDFVYGYASVLARYARWLEERGEDLGALRLRLAITTAEMLLPQDRETIARVFACPVANEYGCRDGGLIAHECPRGSLHLMHDAVHVEVLGEDLAPASPGTTGEVALTNLHAWGAPLLRYRLGDRVALAEAPCGCGLPHPALRGVEGRVTDSLVKDDGSRVHGLALIYILRELPGVARFRCVQDRRGQVRIEIVPGAALDRESLPVRVVDRVRRVLGATTEVDVQLRSELETLASGKHRFVICNVPEGA